MDLFKKNMGLVERIARITLAIVLALLSLLGVVQGVLQIVLGVVAGVMLLTSAIGSCPLYNVIGVSTLKEKK